MLNILSSEFYKIFRNKITYIVSLLFVLLSILSVVVSFIIQKSDSFSADDKSALRVTGFDSYRSSFSADMVFYIILIFVACFITAEFANGSIRRMACHGISRWKLVLGQYIALSSVITLILIGFGMLNLILDTILYDLGNTDKSIFLHMNIGLICMIWGMAGIGTFLSYLFKHSGVTIAVSFIFVTFENFFCILIASATKNTIFYNYQLKNMRSFIVNYESEPNDVTTCALIFLGFGILSVLGSILLFTKKDIE